MRRLQHRYFLVKFAKFLRTPILKNTCERLLLSVNPFVPRHSYRLSAKKHVGSIFFLNFFHCLKKCFARQVVAFTKFFWGIAKEYEKNGNPNYSCHIGGGCEGLMQFLNMISFLFNNLLLLRIFLTRRRFVQSYYNLLSHFWVPIKFVFWTNQLS